MIEIKSVNKTFGDVKAVDNIDGTLDRLDGLSCLLLLHIKSNPFVKGSFAGKTRCVCER